MTDAQQATPISLLVTYQSACGLQTRRGPLLLEPFHASAQGSNPATFYMLCSRFAECQRLPVASQPGVLCCAAPSMDQHTATHMHGVSAIATHAVLFLETLGPRTHAPSPNVLRRAGGGSVCSPPHDGCCVLLSFFVDTPRVCCQLRSQSCLQERCGVCGTYMPCSLRACSSALTSLFLHTTPTQLARWWRVVLGCTLYTSHMSSGSVFVCAFGPVCVDVCED